MKKLLTSLLVAAVAITAFAGSKAVIKETGAGTQVGTAATQFLGFWGAPPVAQVSGTTELMTLLRAIGLVSTGSTGAVLKISGTTANPVTGQIAVSGSNLLIYTGTAGGWVTK